MTDEALSKLSMRIKLIDRLGAALTLFTRSPPLHASSLQTVLLICMDNIAEIIRSLPTIELLKSNFKQSCFDILTGESSRSILEAHPAIEHLIIYNASWIRVDPCSMEAPSDQSIISLAWELRKKNYMAVICFRPDFRLNLMAFLIRAPIRIGYGSHGGGFFLTHDLDQNQQSAGTPKYSEILSAFNIKASYRPPKIVPLPADVATTQAILNGLIVSKPIAVVYPGGVQARYRWLGRHVRSLIHELIHDEFQVLLLGDPQERDLMEVVSQGLPSEFVQLWNFPTFGEVVALAQKTDIYLGLDSGISQIMAAVGTPSVILKANTGEKIPGYIGIRTRIIYPTAVCKSCSDAMLIDSNPETCKCMENIGVRDVVDAYRQLTGR